MQIVIICHCPRHFVANTVIADLVDGECIFSAALLDTEGFTLERTSNEFKPTTMAAILDLNPDSPLVTIVAEECTVIASRLESGHTIVVQCPSSSNLGKARMKIAHACKAILPFL
jgi:hypothetical protein